MEKKTLNIEIGRRIREKRESAGLNREQLAELVDITPRFVADIERGSVGLSISNLRKMCEALNVSSDSILWDSNNSIGIDDKLKHIKREYIELIERVVQAQINIINLVEKERKQ